MRQNISVFFAASLLLGTVAAQDANPLAGPPLALDVSIVRQVIEGMSPAVHVFINMGFKEYALQAPEGFRVQNEPAQGRLMLQRMDNSCWISLRIIKTPVGGANLSTSAGRDWVQGEFPNAKITGESSANAGNNGGPAFDLAWQTGGFQQSARVVYIPSAVGILEFKLVGNTSQFGESLNYLKNVLTSFRFCPNGKRDLPTLSKVS
jgi:hypothetical protein